MSDRPNILLLQTDQQRWDALGCQSAWIKTPNLDTLAARGIRFPQAICNSPMCVPSRYSMLTGLYGSQLGSRHNSQCLMQDAALLAPTLAQRLQCAGYQTAGSGKTHWWLDTLRGHEIEPSKRGFEWRAIARRRGGIDEEPDSVFMPDEYPEIFTQLRREAEGQGSGGEGVTGYLGLVSQVPANRQREAWLADKAIQFIERDWDRKRPFFLYVSFDFPHAGFNVPPGYEELYALEDIPAEWVRPERSPWEHLPQLGHTMEFAERWQTMDEKERRRVVARYAALCTFADEQFGRVLASLKAQGLLDRIHILFTSDHGESLGERGRWSKYSLYEASLRVPLLVAGPAVEAAKAGTLDERPAELVDVLPTVLQMAGLESPPELPGFSLLEPCGRLGAFAELHGVGCEELQEAPTYCWRTAEWKLILRVPGSIVGAQARVNDAQGELYNLREDPRELRNLFADTSVAAVRERMTRELLLNLACVWARFPTAPGRPALRERDILNNDTRKHDYMRRSSPP